MAAMKYLPAATLLIMSAQAWSCSCFGTSSIRETIATHPNLVEVQAVSVSGNEATLRVTRVLKGTVSPSTIQVGHWMCYACLYPELMKPQHTYVLPLGEPAAGKDPLEVPRAGEAIATIDGAKEGNMKCRAALSPASSWLTTSYTRSSQPLARGGGCNSTVSIRISYAGVRFPKFSR
jgi:hypothetical protein